MDRSLRWGGKTPGKGLIDPFGLGRAVGRDPVTGTRLHWDGAEVSTSEYAPSSTSGRMHCEHGTHAKCSSHGTSGGPARGATTDVCANDASV
jgi:hypothetical protein